MIEGKALTISLECNKWINFTVISAISMVTKEKIQSLYYTYQGVLDKYIKKYRIGQDEFPVHTRKPAIKMVVWSLWAILLMSGPWFPKYRYNKDIIDTLYLVLENTEKKEYLKTWDGK